MVRLIRWERAWNGNLSFNLQYFLRFHKAVHDYWSDVQFVVFHTVAQIVTHKNDRGGDYSLEKEKKEGGESSSPSE